MVVAGAEEAGEEAGEAEEQLLPLPLLALALAREHVLVEEQAAVWKSTVAQAVEAATTFKHQHPIDDKNMKTQTGGASSGSGSGSAARLAHVAAAPPATAPPTAAAPTRLPKRPEDAELAPVDDGVCHDAALLRCSSSSACFLASACRSLQVSFFPAPVAAPALGGGSG